MKSKVIFLLLVVACLSTTIVSAADGFAWEDTAGEYLDLTLDGRKVVRYMYAYDTSTAARQHETYKVLYHVFDEKGEKVLTKGPDGETPYEKGQYTHHRGIYIGWNRLKFDGKSYDLWHMKGTVQKHIKFLEKSVSAKSAKLKTLIHWLDDKGRILISEERELIVYRQSKQIVLLDVNTELTAASGDVELNGDPEHAGFQYRPHNDVAAGPKSVKAKYLFHTDGIDAHKDGDLPWVAMSYGLNGKRYSVLHITHPGNPKPYVYSAYRDYGRFGSFFKKNLSKGQTLSLKYRIGVMEGELPSRAKMAKEYEGYLKH